METRTSQLPAFRSWVSVTGWWRDRLAPAASSLWFVMCVVVLWGSVSVSPALAARGHVFENETFGEAGAGDGQFSNPSGIAINEATGRIYVVDGGNHRVEYFSAEGAYEGQFTGPEAAGTGNLTAGQKTIKSAKTSSGTFAVGEEIVATGLPAATRISAVKSATELEVSKAATASESGASLTATDPFSGLQAIAVDNACHLRKLAGSACASADQSNEDVYVSDSAGAGIEGSVPGTSRSYHADTVDKFSATGAYLGQLIETPGEVAIKEEGRRLGGVAGIAVDSGGRVWLNETQGAENFVTSFDASGAFLSSFPTYGHGAGAVAMDTVGHLWLGQAGRIVEYSESGERLSKEGEPLDEEASTGVAVEETTGDVYVDNVTSVARFSSARKYLERFGSGALSEGTGVAVNPESGVVYVVDRAENRVAIFPLEPPAHPVMRDIGIEAVGASKATLTAEVNPRSELGEPETAFGVEYSQCASLTSCNSIYGPQVVTQTFPPDFELHQAAAQLTGLSSHTVYHARIFARNEYGEEASEQLIFTTEATGFTFALPDGRAWEMVSPPNKHGAGLLGVGRGIQQAAGLGGAFIYQAFAPIESEAQGNRIEEAQALSRRGAHGWSTQEIAAPNSHFTGYPIGFKGEYALFSSDLSLGLMYPAEAGEPSLTPQASGWAPYLRHDFASSTETCPVDPSACWTPLVTAKEPWNDVAPSTELEPDSFTLQGAAPDLSRAIVFARETRTLYEWTAAEPWTQRLSTVGVLPDGTTAECKTGGGAELGDAVNFGMGNAVAADGTRVFFEAKPGTGACSGPLTHHLYLRDVVAGAEGETLQVDAVQPGTERSQREAEAPDPTFQAATPDGGTVFFTDRQRLTADASQYPKGGETTGDLYECEVKSNASTGKLECALADLTPKNGVGEAAEAEGTVLGTGDNGDDVYFVARAVLAAGAEAGKPNVYVAHGRDVTFIATLSEEDSADWTTHSDKISRVSPNGHWLEFMSERALTGYDNRDVTSGDRDEEVYLYDVEARKLVCASCNPTGQRPEGEVAYTIEKGPTLIDDEGRGPWQNRWVAATVPSLVGAGVPENEPSYQPRYLSNGGRLFFDARDPLSPFAKNKTWDVYEYEPPKSTGTSGSDGCSVSSVSYSEQDGGCISLISSGSDEHEAAFLDASENGDEVFFLTAAKLWPHQDYDTAYDVYDAHVCSSASPCIPEPAKSQPCAEAEACREAPQPQPQVFGPPSTATFSGKGDVTPAKPQPNKLTRKQEFKRALKRCDAHYKHNRQKRRLCERRVRKKFLTPKQLLQITLHNCRHRHRHQKRKLRFCMRRARHRLRHHAHAARRHRKTGSRRRGR